MVLNITIPASRVKLGQQVCQQYQAAQLSDLRQEIARHPQLIGLLAELMEEHLGDLPAMLEGYLEDAPFLEAEIFSFKAGDSGDLEVSAQLSAKRLQEIERVLDKYCHLNASPLFLQQLVTVCPDLLWEFCSGGIGDTYARETLSWAIDQIFFDGKLERPCNADGPQKSKDYFSAYYRAACHHGVWAEPLS